MSSLFSGIYLRGKRSSYSHVNMNQANSDICTLMRPHNSLIIEYYKDLKGICAPTSRILLRKWFCKFYCTICDSVTSSFSTQQGQSKVKLETIKLIKYYTVNSQKLFNFESTVATECHCITLQICIWKSLARGKTVYRKRKKTQLLKAFRRLDYAKPIFACFNKMTVLWQHRWTLELSLKLLDQSSFTLHKSSLCSDHLV